VIGAIFIQVFVLLIRRAADREQMAARLNQLAL
jgi:hypothetical protein